jgi:hypothetical protein
MPRMARLEREHPNDALLRWRAGLLSTEERELDGIALYLIA